MYSGSQITKEHYEACTVGVKMATIKGRRLALENLGKDWVGEGHKTPEDPGKGLNSRKETLLSPTPKEISSKLLALSVSL